MAAGGSTMADRQFNCPVPRSAEAPPSMFAAAANWAQAIRTVSNSVRTVVMSMPPAQPNHGSPFGRASWLAEQIMEWASIDLQIIRIMAFFHENLDAFHSESIVSRSVMSDAYGWGPISWMSSADSADIVLDAMLHLSAFNPEDVAEASALVANARLELRAALTRKKGK